MTGAELPIADRRPPDRRRSSWERPPWRRDCGWTRSTAPAAKDCASCATAAACCWPARTTPPRSRPPAGCWNSGAAATTWTIRWAKFSRAAKRCRSAKLDLQEKPGFLYRSIWGSQWSGDTLWKIWNGHGGVPLNTGHAWGNYVSQGPVRAASRVFPPARRPARGERLVLHLEPGAAAAFAQGVIERIQAGTQHPSISPPDGRGYCECDRCRAQDDPHSLEPSSGHVASPTATWTSTRTWPSRCSRRFPTRF